MIIFIVGAVLILIVFFTGLLVDWDSIRYKLTVKSYWKWHKKFRDFLIKLQ
jgi:hypothetical protein